MNHKIIIFSAVSLMAAAVVAGPMERVKNGFGATLSATTTPQEMVIRQIPNADIVDNGTFATTNSWTLGDDWAITGGAAVYTASGGVVTTTNSMYQTNTNLVKDTVYRVTYTIAGMDTGTNTLQLYLGDTPGTLRTADGTYTDDLYMWGASNITFTAVSTNDSAFTLDNVKLSKLADKAYVNFMQMRSGPGELPVHFILNGDAEAMTNAYAHSQCMILSSNTVITIDDQTGEKKIDRIWYRSASGTASVTFNGN